MFCSFVMFLLFCGASVAHNVIIAAMFFDTILISGVSYLHFVLKAF